MQTFVKMLFVSLEVWGGVINQKLLGDANATSPWAFDCYYMLFSQWVSVFKNRMVIFFYFVTLLSGTWHIRFGVIPYAPDTSLGKSPFSNFKYLKLLRESSRLWQIHVLYKELVLFIISCVYIQESLQIQIHNSLIFWEWTRLWPCQYLLSIVVMVLGMLNYLQGEERSGEWNLASLRSCARILMKEKWRQSLLGGCSAGNIY